MQTGKVHTPPIDTTINESAQTSRKDPPPSGATTPKPVSTMQEPTIDDTSPSAKASAKIADAPPSASVSAAPAATTAATSTAKPPSSDAPVARPPVSVAETTAPPPTAPPSAIESNPP